MATNTGMMKKDDKNLQNQLVITGATNNPGRVFVECLAADPDAVNQLFPGGIVSVFRESSDTRHFDALLPEAQKAVCDLREIGALTDAFRRADTVFHIAGIHWSREVAVAASLCGIRRLIVVHTCGIYSKYKAAGREYRNIDRFVQKCCKDHGILLTILRPTMIFGCRSDRNLIHLIRMVDRFPFMPVINGGQYALQPVYYEDLGCAFFSVLMQEKSTASRDFVLSGERSVLFSELIMCIGKCLGKQVKLISIPYWAAYPAAWLLYVMSLKRLDLREKIQRLCEPRAFGHEAATEAFSFIPHSLESCIQKEVSEYLSEKAPMKKAHLI